MNMTVVPPDTEQKREVTFGDFKALNKRANRGNLLSKTLELMQANLIKVDEEVFKQKGPNGQTYVLQAYYNQKKDILAYVRCKKDEARTPEAVYLTSLETSDRDNTMHVYKGPEGNTVDMCAFYHNPVTNRQDWALDAGLLDPAKYKRIETAKIA